MAVSCTESPQYDGALDAATTVLYTNILMVCVTERGIGQALLVTVTVKKCRPVSEADGVQLNAPETVLVPLPVIGNVEPGIEVVALLTMVRVVVAVESVDPTLKLTMPPLHICRVTLSSGAAPMGAVTVGSEGVPPEQRALDTT
jgi:hypothetical protein